MSATPTLGGQYYNASTATSKATGSITYTSGDVMVVLCALRASDLASTTSETIQLSASGNTFTQIGSQASFDASSRFRVACFLCSGGTGGAITMSTVASRSIDRWILIGVRVSGSSHATGPTAPTNVSVGTNASGTSLGMGALSSMAATSITLLVGCSDANTLLYTPESSPSAWATALADGTNGTLHSFAGYFAGQDTSPGGTKTNNIEHYAFAMEILAAATGRPRVIAPSGLVIGESDSAARLLAPGGVVL